MFLLHGKSVIDPDLELLVEILEVIDKQLETALQGWTDAAEADELGYFDRAEHIIGLGFVACQAYMTSTYGFLNISKLSALAFGPKHGTGQTIVHIINHAANFWKHHDEWHLDKSASNQNRIRKAFETVGFSVDLDYPLSGVLAELVAPHPTGFKTLSTRLEQWRDELRTAVA